jgi:hypothetical protein
MQGGLTREMQWNQQKHGKRNAPFEVLELLVQNMSMHQHNLTPTDSGS